MCFTRGGLAGLLAGWLWDMFFQSLSSAFSFFFFWSGTFAKLEGEWVVGKGMVCVCV